MITGGVFGEGMIKEVNKRQEEAIGINKGRLLEMIQPERTTSRINMSIDSSH